MTGLQIVLTPKAKRMCEDLIEAFDNDPEGLADFLGYSFERMDESMCNIMGAIKTGVSVPLHVTHKAII